MSDSQAAPYKPAPVSQRDGSALANSNCRMASIATGIDYHTQGATTSSGSRMRSYTSDQSGGTDSGDAVESWRIGYGQTLEVRDGYTFDNALQDLVRGQLVHLDVWHASCGSASGICKSGSGAYGHTIAVLPDYSVGSNGWLVADPWCSPAKWGRVPEAQLRAGAEEWGRRVYGAAVLEADYPDTAGRIGDPLNALALAIIRRIARELMSRAYPGLEETLPAPPTPPDWGETGGGKPCLFTRTKAIAPSGGGGGDDMARYVQANGYGVGAGKLIKMKSGEAWEYLDGSPGGTFSGDINVPCFGLVDSSLNHYAVSISTGRPYADGGQRTTIAAVRTTAAPYDAPPPTPPEPVEPETDEEAYQRGRADEWATWANSLGIPPDPTG
jgi:hypothetical protein